MLRHRTREGPAERDASGGGRPYSMVNDRR